jgi:3'(2'), 5'-bisphosphate nucleotidase
MRSLEEEVEASIDDLLGVAYGAGEIIMQYLSRGFKTFTKSDNSPVTDADIASDQFITENLQKIIPGVTVVSEEGYEDNPDQYNNTPDEFWCVDPLDGTKNFIEGRPDEFTVNIGLVENKKPIFGMLFVPNKNLMYFSTLDGGFKILNGEKSRMGKGKFDTDINIVTSRRMPDDKIEYFIKKTGIKDVRFGCKKMAGSEKFCHLADSHFNIFPMFAPSYEWDTAAGHAILNAVGGKVFGGKDGQELEYNKRGFRNNGFVAMTDPKMILPTQLSNIVQNLHEFF